MREKERERGFFSFCLSFGREWLLLYAVLSASGWLIVWL